MKKEQEEQKAIEEDNIVQLGHFKVGPDAMVQIKAFYERYLVDEMGNLHNRFLAFISESHLPITHVVMALEILLQEARDMAIKKYTGK